MGSEETARHVAAILNAAWMVRHYHRGARSIISREHRHQALLQLGLTCREAFNSTEDFEAVLRAIVDGLAPRDEHRF